MRYKELIAQLIPKNSSLRAWIADVIHIKGAPQSFTSIAEMVAFHPEKLRKGQSVNVVDYPGPGQIAEFRLKADPETMMDASKNSIVTLDNFLSYWNQQTYESIEEQSAERIYQYAAPYNGGLPPFPYSDYPAQESIWEDFYDATKGHAYVRFRTDDEDLDEDGIFDNWTRPFPIGTSFETGDYIENRYLRQNVSLVDFTEDNVQTQGTDPLVDTKYYQVVSDETVTVNGETLTRGRRFQYNSGDVVVFDSPLSTLNETLAPPPRTITQNGNVVPNNTPKFIDGRDWADEPTVGIDQLWEITAQKTVYGNLKSDWKIRKVIESPDLTRYSRNSSPNPQTLVGTNSKADPNGTVDEIANDQLLTDNGWLSAYTNDTIFIAYREEVSPGVYTNWLIDKISEESGEYIDRVYRLFPYVIDNDDQLLIDNTPQTERPYDEGWFDGPQIETDTEINYVSEARRFFDGSLKTTWSRPVPFTGKDVFNDIIVSDSDNYFRTDPNNDNSDPQNPATIPDTITLTCQLFKGTVKLWERDGAQLSFAWRQITDNGAALPDETQYRWNASDGSPLYDEAIDPDTIVENIYGLDSFGTPGNEGYLFDYQRIRIKPNGITGTSTFECTVTFTLTNGKTAEFISRFTIADLSDGLDAETLYLSTSSLGFTKTTTKLGLPGEATVVEPSSIVLKANFTNLVTENNLTWQIETTPGVWVDLLSNVTTSALTLTKQGDNTVDITTAGILTSGVPNAEDIFNAATSRRFRVTHPLLPEGDIITINQFVVETTDGKDGDRFATTSDTDITTPTNNTTPATITITVETELSYSPGQTVIVYESASYNFEGSIDSYNSVTGEMILSNFTNIVGPTTAVTGQLSVNLTGAKGEQGQDGVQGIGNIRPVLGNENLTIVLNSESLAVSPANQLGNNGITETPIYVIQGGTLVSTSFWQFMNTGVDDNSPNFDDGGTITGANGATLTIEPTAGNPSERRAYIDTGDWPDGLRSDYFDIQVRVTNAANGDALDTDTINAGSQPLDVTIRYTIATSVDAPGAKQLIVVSDSGYAFTKANAADKNLRADYFDSGAGDDVLTSGYWYRWTKRNASDNITATANTNTTGETPDGFVSDTNSGRLKTVTRANVNSSQRFAVDVSSDGTTAGIIRTTFFQIDDVADGDVVIAYYGRSIDNGNVTPPTNPEVLNGGPVTYDSLPTSGNGKWTKEGGTYTFWSCVGNDLDGATEWGPVIKIRGERGNQGPNGDGYVYLYKALNNNLPSANASIATMLGDSWSATPPTVSGAGEVVYQAQARFEGSDFSDFDVSGLPRNLADDGYSPLIGNWSTSEFFRRPNDPTNGINAVVNVVSTTTGAPGTNASVIDTNGNSRIADLEFTIPRGDKGNKGDKGDTGAAGTNGIADGVSKIRRYYSNQKFNSTAGSSYSMLVFDTEEASVLKNVFLDGMFRVKNKTTTVAGRSADFRVYVSNTYYSTVASVLSGGAPIVRNEPVLIRMPGHPNISGSWQPINLKHYEVTSSRYLYLVMFSTSTENMQFETPEGLMYIMT